jgi:poly(beta-D-mannuronate) lyase
MTLALSGISATSAVAAGTSLTASRTSGITGETVTFKGQIGTKFTRYVVLQRYDHAWKAVKTARTNSAGAFTIATSIRGSDTTYRVSASKVKRKGAWAAARSTPNRRILTQAQSARLSGSSSPLIGEVTTLTWSFQPARPGRSVIIERLDRSGWTAIATGTQSSAGSITFAWTPEQAGPTELRAVAQTYRGAVEYRTSTHTVTVTSDQPMPASILDLTNWKLTLPVGTDDHPDDAIEVKQPALAAFEDRQFFHANGAGTGVVFRANAGGATTSGSSYPRSELREMTDHGTSNAGWSNESGRHVMTVTEAVTALPAKKPHVVAAQIHDRNDDVIMVRLENKRLFVEADGNNIGELDTTYVLGTPFTVEIRATAIGIAVSYNGVPKVSYAKVGSGWYFKAGCYTQSNTSTGDSADAYGEVVIYALSVEHT